MTRQPFGSVDGIRLDELVVGVVYDIGTTLGCYLLAQEVAEPVDEDVPAAIPPWAEMRFSPVEPTEEAEPAPIAELHPLSEAADQPRRRKRT